jgi:hypothetical protein
MSHETLYYLTLKRIAKHYHKVEWFEKHAANTYGLSPHEALEMAYENIITDAANAIHGKRPPRLERAEHMLGKEKL